MQMKTAVLRDGGFCGRKADKLSFMGVTLSALWADTLLRNEGNGLPRQCTHWLAMTYLSFLIAPNLLRKRTKITVIAKPEGLWQSASSASEGCSATVGRRILLVGQAIIHGP